MTVGDIVFANGFRSTEANRVYGDAPPDAGLYPMSPDWEPIAYFTRDGHILIKGNVVEGWEFDRHTLPPPQ